MGSPAGADDSRRPGGSGGCCWRNGSQCRGPTPGRTQLTAAAPAGGPVSGSLPALRSLPAAAAGGSAADKFAAPSGTGMPLPRNGAPTSPESLLNLELLRGPLRPLLSSPRTAALAAAEAAPAPVRAANEAWTTAKPPMAPAMPSVGFTEAPMSIRSWKKAEETDGRRWWGCESGCWRWCCLDLSQAFMLAVALKAHRPQRGFQQ